ncbi:MAG TPA: efflux RND transporter periplasmic adaptor subunit [Pirellulales bacterium]|jgi:multidrug efflux pump subunit AcrA (membrane-fusion protein)
MQSFLRYSAPLAALGAIVIAGCSHKEHGAPQAEAQAQAVPVTVATVERRSLEATIDVVGTLKGWEDVKVGAQKGGRVIKILHEVGDRVRPGDALVELETINAELQVQQAEKRLSSELAKLGLKELPKGEFNVNLLPSVVQAQVGVDRAKQKYSREQALSERKVNTIESMQEAEFNLRDAKAHLDNTILTAHSTLAAAMASQIEIAVARQARADMVVRAPRPSKLPEGFKEQVEYAVIRRMVSAGQMIREGEEVAELIMDNPLRMWANVPERFSRDVATGQPVRLAVSSQPDKTYMGTVTWVNPSVDSGSRTFQVEVSVPNDERELRSGGFAKASIVTRQDSDQIVVPAESIVRFAGVTKVFVVQGGKARSVPIEAGLERAGWAPVQGEIAVGAQVVMTGQSQLADDTLVTVRGAAEAQAAPADQASPVFPTTGGGNAEAEAAPAATKTARPETESARARDAKAGG